MVGCVVHVFAICVCAQDAMCRGSMHHTKDACISARAASIRTQMLIPVLCTPTPVVVHAIPMSARGVQHMILDSQEQVRLIPLLVLQVSYQATGTTIVSVH